MGPGWDGRYRLADLTPQEQVKRYNHTFTHEEISAPSGSRNLETGQLEGGMPVDVPYLELEPVDEAKRELPENN